LVTHHDLESVLIGVLEAAQDLTDARFAALGILDSEKESIERFVFLGLDDDQARRIGPLPQGLGVLGELIRGQTPMRLADLGEHPRSYGFPAEHPRMQSFVGVPVMIRGEAFGILYLTDKRDAREFELRDEHLLTVLADWAAVAIDNARLYDEADRRRSELERAVQGLEATVSLSRLGTSQGSLDWLLERIAKRGRALVESRWFVLLRSGESEEDELVAAQVAGEVPADIPEMRLPNGDAVLHGLLRGGIARRLAPTELIPSALGISQATILAVLDDGGHQEGFLIAVDPFARAAFSSDDQQLLTSFAASAANAIRTFGEVEKDRLRLSAQSSERERRRWARELHDETLQQLGAMKLMHEGALKRDDPDLYRRTVERAAAEFGDTIESLERLITELRPIALDELGTAAALEALVEKIGTSSDLKVDLEIDLAFDGNRDSKRHSTELETTVYRIVQEGLNNVLKHAEADSVSISVIENGDRLELTVADDGKGFVEAHEHERFGLSGLRERVELAGGEMTIKSAPERGTTLRATLPVTRGDAGPESP
jgi:signal transduction histidine kinase